MEQKRLLLAKNKFKLHRMQCDQEVGVTLIKIPCAKEPATSVKPIQAQTSCSFRYLGR